MCFNCSSILFSLSLEISKVYLDVKVVTGDGSENFPRVHPGKPILNNGIIKLSLKNSEATNKSITGGRPNTNFQSGKEVGLIGLFCSESNYSPKNEPSVDFE